MTTNEPKPGSENPSGPAKAAALDAQSIKAKKPGLFSRETRLGRALRAFLRTLAFIVGFFALGFFTGYVLLYQPLQRQARDNAAALAEAQQALTDKQTELDKAALTFVASEAENRRLTGELDKATVSNGALTALYQVGEARVKLAGNDRSGARLALDEAEKGLTPLLPKFESLAGTKPETITQLFELARGDLERDARLAQQDMERLASELKLIVESVNP